MTASIAARKYSGGKVPLRLGLGALARQQLQHAEQAEPSHESLFLDSRLPGAVVDADCPTLGWVEPTERNFDAHVDAISLTNEERRRHRSSA